MGQFDLNWRTSGNFPISHPLGSARPAAPIGLPAGEPARLRCAQGRRRVAQGRKDQRCSEARPPRRWWVSSVLQGFTGAPRSRPSRTAADTPRNSGSVQELPQVVVIGNAPLPGFGLPLNEVPANVQTADSLGPEACPDDGYRRLPESQLQRGERQRKRGQPLPAGHQLSRLHRLAAARAPPKACRCTSMACASTSPSATR